MKRVNARMALVLGGALALTSACGDGDDPAPLVAVVGASPSQLVVDDDALDDLTLTLDYRDADGDLGTGLAEVFDCRAVGVVVTLPLPAIASDEAVAQGVPIEGVLEVIVADVGAVAADPVAPAACADLGVAVPENGDVVFCVYLTDAAGHTGPGDCTGPISLVSARD